MSESNFKCSKCPNVAKSLAAFYCHKKLHKNGRNIPKATGHFSCSFCGKVLKTKQALNGHQGMHPKIVGAREKNNRIYELINDVQETVNDPDNLLQRITNKPGIQQELEKQKVMLAGLNVNCKAIPSNLYSPGFDIAKVAIKDISHCKCKKKCISERCISSKNLMECHPGKCGAKECSNNCISLAKTQPTYIKKAKDGKGFGLFAEVAIPAKTFICEYIGEIINEQDCKKRLDDGNGNFMMSIQFAVGGIIGYIDSTHVGNSSRFINYPSN